MCSRIESTVTTLADYIFKYTKMEPIIKHNDGKGAILCNMCSIILKENLSKEEFEGETDLLLCDKCSVELLLQFIV